MSDRKPMLSPEELAFVKGNGFQPHPQAAKAAAANESPTPAPEAEAKPTRRNLPMSEAPEATIRFTVDLRRSQHEQLKRAALDARMPMTALIRHIVSDWLAEGDAE